MTDERDEVLEGDVVDEQALEPLQHTALEGPAVDGITALAEMSDSDFEDKLQALVKGRDRIAQIKRTLMVDGVHYGTIPGTDKPALLQPGSQLLCMVYGLRARFEKSVDYGDGITAPAVRVRTTCYLHLGSLDGPVVATGDGAASTWERKHRYRRGDRACPECGTLGSIIRGKPEYGGGFVCWKRKDGCGAKFEKTDRAILDQQVGDVENEDQADLENTVIKMSEKRAYIGATLRGTASSDLFTQDLEQGDGPGDDGGRPGPQRPEAAQQGPVQQPQANGQAAEGPDPAPGAGAVLEELHEARSLFPADVSKTITTSQQGRLYNLAGKNGWHNAGVDDEIARCLSMPTEQLPAIGDAYEAVVRWFQTHQPSSEASA